MSSVRARALSSWFALIFPVRRTQKALNIYLKKWKNEWNPFTHKAEKCFSFTQWIEYFLLASLQMKESFQGSCATAAGKGSDGLQSSCGRETLGAVFVCPSTWAVVCPACESLSAVFVFCSVFHRLECKVYQYRSVHCSRLSSMVDYSHM